MSIRTPEHLKLNFPPSTTLKRIAAELYSAGYIISAHRNRDGSHDVVERPSPRAQTVATRELEGLMP
jgi:hypothetical protein